jgi:two-component system cell cycle sensor histidine kinase PleC
MSKAADKPEVVQLPAEPPAAAPASNRRAAAQRVREARDRLTSSSGTRPAFDRELLRQYAQTRMSASLVVMLLVVATGLLFGVWMQPLSASAWTVGMLCIHFAIMRACVRFLAEQPTLAAIRKWRTRFVLLDLFYGFGWMAILVHPALGAVSGTLMMFLMLLVIAVSSMLAANLPIAALAATVPITVAVALNFVLSGKFDNYLLAAFAIAAEGYFALLAHRLHSTTLATLEARAEKDALIGELEQAKSISDEARHRAESANVAKSRFLAQMSHELRTPLNAILGFSEVMKSEIFGAHAVPVYREYSADIHNSGVHLLNLINEILDLSRIEAGRYELNEEAVSLVNVVADCHHLLKLRASSRGITIHEAFERAMPRVWGDERAVRQVVLNLLSNAVKFTPQSGKVALTVTRSADGGQMVSVRDNGPGIPEEEIETVLASFGQGSLAQKTAEQGAGLGLPIVQKIMELHQGRFDLFSKLRFGTEVIATFPRARVMDALAPVVERKNRLEIYSEAG